MPDKLSIICDELILTGNNPVTSEDDGSDEWNVASPAYDNAVEHLLDEHDWKFATAIAPLQRTGDAQDSQFEDEFAKPNGCLHVIWVRVDDVPVNYKVIGNRINLTAGNGSIVMAKFVREPAPDQWPGLFLKALRCFVRAGVYAGLNDDPDEAHRQESKGNAYLKQAKSRSDQEEPARALFKGRARLKRRVRRYQ